MKLLVIGSINMDLITETKVLPAMGETVFGESFGTVCGGKGANQAVAAAKCGAQTYMIGAVGNDMFGERALENLKTNGVDVTGIKTVPTSTGVAAITVYGGDNCIILNKGANALIDKKLIDDNADLIDKADVVLFQLEIPYETVLYAAQICKSKGKTVVLNPAPISGFSPEILKYTDILIPNEFEAGNIVGYTITEDNCEQALMDLLKLGCGQAVITLGSKGCVYNVGSEIKRCGVYSVTAVDSTAAGDSFIGGFCISKFNGKSNDDAVKYASAVSAIAVSRMGAASSIPDKGEVELFMKEHSIS